MEETRRSISRPFGDDVDAAVLRQAALGDVHLADDLDARDDGRVHAVGGGHQLAQNAVDAVADAGVAAVGSMWMSLAPSRMAVMIARLTRLMIGLPSTIWPISCAVVLVDRLALDDLDLAFGQVDEERVDVDFLAQVLVLELGDVAFQGQHGVDLAAGEPN